MRPPIQGVSGFSRKVVAVFHLWWQFGKHWHLSLFVCSQVALYMVKIPWHCLLAQCSWWMHTSSVIWPHLLKGIIAFRSPNFSKHELWDVSGDILGKALQSYTQFKFLYLCPQCWEWSQGNQQANQKYFSPKKNQNTEQLSDQFFFVSKYLKICELIQLADRDEARWINLM